MPTYIVAQELEIVRQEGDTCDVKFTVPETLSIDGYRVNFMVRSVDGEIIIDKSTDGDRGIDVENQDITVSIDPEDTGQRSGTHRWELEISGGVYGTITIGRGDFVIMESIIK